MREEQTILKWPMQWTGTVFPICGSTLRKEPGRHIMKMLTLIIFGNAKETDYLKMAILRCKMTEKKIRNC